MDSILEKKVKDYLVNRLKYQKTDCGAIVFNMRKVATACGAGFTEKFGEAGLGAGPEARIASEIVDRATLGGGGSASSEAHMRSVIDRWIRNTPPMGA